MIIFYNKKTGEITGTIDGRVHDKHTLEKTWVGDKKGIAKYVVPFEPNVVQEEIPLTELKVIDGKLKEVIVGKEKRNVIRGLKLAVSFANLIYDLEDKKRDIYDYKAKLSKKGQVLGFVKVKTGKK